jgi:hypothetical protein
LSNIKREDLERFKTNISLVSAKLSSAIAKIITENDFLKTEEVLYSLLKIAGFISCSSGCSKEIFVKLAKIAFEEEEVIRSRSSNDLN